MTSGPQVRDKSGIHALVGQPAHRTAFSRR